MDLGSAYATNVSDAAGASSAAAAADAESVDSVEEIVDPVRKAEQLARNKLYAELTPTRRPFERTRNSAAGLMSAFTKPIAITIETNRFDHAAALMSYFSAVQRVYETNHSAFSVFCDYFDEESARRAVKEAHTALHAYMDARANFKRYFDMYKRDGKSVLFMRVEYCLSLSYLPGFSKKISMEIREHDVVAPELTFEGFEQLQYDKIVKNFHEGLSTFLADPARKGIGRSFRCPVKAGAGETKKRSAIKSEHSDDDSSSGASSGASATKRSRH
jgi:hypothetical protein